MRPHWRGSCCSPTRWRGTARPLACSLTAGAAGCVAFGIAAAATLADALGFLFDTTQGFSGEGGVHGENSTQVFGYLARQLPVYQALGVWPANDFRFPMTGVRWALTIAAMAIAGVLIAVAVASELRRRRLGALLLLGPAALTFLVAAPRLAPYAEAKLLMVLSPAAVFAAGIGAWRVGRTRRLRIPALAAGGALAVGIVASNAIAYHQVRVAPTDRLEALEDAAERAPRSGLLLLNEWEEFGKYFGRTREINTASESFSPRVIVQRDPSVPIFAHSFDLDEMTLDYVQSFPAIVLRRSPTASRPPLSFTRVYRNDYYELWRRGAQPRVLEHLSLQPLHERGAEARCADVRALARRAGPGERVAGVPAPELPGLDVAAKPPVGWNENGIEDTVTPGSPGDPAATVRVGGGRYRVWMRGGSGRALTVEVDGRDAGEVQGVNTPGQWLPGGEVQLAAGAHELRLVRPGGSLAPGDGYAAEIGPVVLEPVREAAPVTVAPDRAEATFCEGRWDWVERAISLRKPRRSPTETSSTAIVSAARSPAPRYTM